ncbi:MAG: ribonuclease III [Candidatus Peribacteria bacterium]|jgi:ribonuclease-3|nr:ribonuclease III [Candidatus Peribacteria bacterium]
MTLLIPSEVSGQLPQLITYLASLGIDISKIQDTDLFLSTFIHKSYAADFKEITSHNERLEFVGDAILGAIIAKLLFLRNPEMSESIMTLYKIALVREETLAEVSKDIKLDMQIFISKGEEHSKGREKETILGDAFEALLGYLYLDMGEPTVEYFVNKYLYPKIKTISKHPVKSYKTMVQEIIQRETKITPEYFDSEFVVDDKKNVIQYKSELLVNGEKKAEGFGTNKKKAQEAAAKNFYELQKKK